MGNPRELKRATAGVFALLGATSGILLIGVVPIARAQDGVHISPDSPPGKEYAIPLDQARQAAASGAQRPGPSPVALFGVGIKSHARVGHGAAGGTRGTSHLTSGAPPAARGAGQLGLTSAAVASATARSQGLSVAAVTLLSVTMALVFAALVAFGVRALRRRGPLA